jgi:hypothetical protein
MFNALVRAVRAAQILPTTGALRATTNSAGTTLSVTLPHTPHRPSAPPEMRFLFPYIHNGGADSGTLAIGITPGHVAAELVAEPDANGDPHTVNCPTTGRHELWLIAECSADPQSSPYGLPLAIDSVRIDVLDEAPATHQWTAQQLIGVVTDGTLIPLNTHNKEIVLSALGRKHTQYHPWGQETFPMWADIDLGDDSSSSTSGLNLEPLVHFINA